MNDTPYEALVIVTDRSWEEIADAIAHLAEFVGEPWPVTPINADSGDLPEFGTLEAFAQHPERS